MEAIRKPCLLAVVLLLFSFSIACADSEFTEIKFTKFPEEFQQYHRPPWEMFNFEEFSEAYLQIMDDFPIGEYLDDFICELAIVSEKNRFVSTNQGPFIFMDGCKPHFCGALDIFVLYDPVKAKAWAFTIDGGIYSKKYEEMWLGKPDEKTKNLFKKLIDMRWQ